MNAASLSRPDRVEELIDKWLCAKQARSGSAHTRSSYSRAMRSWRNYLASHPFPTADGYRPADIWDADASLVRGWQTAMRERKLSAATINQALASVSSFYEFVLSERYAPASFRANSFCGNVTRERVSEYAAARALTIDEYDRLLAYLGARSNTVTGARAHALLRTFLHTGWRPGELLAMRWGDLRSSGLAGGGLRYAWTSRSGRVSSDVLPADCYQAILHYLALAGRPVESMGSSDSIWTPIREPDTSGFGASVDPARPICVKTALRVLRTHLRAAGIADADRFRLPDLRHTHTRLLLESGATVAAIQQRLRHSDPKTTDRYLRRAFLDEPTDSHSQAFAALRRR